MKEHSSTQSRQYTDKIKDHNHDYIEWGKLGWLSTKNQYLIERPILTNAVQLISESSIQSYCAS